MVKGLELKKLILENIELPQHELVELATSTLGYSKSHVKRLIYSMKDWSDEVAPISPENSEKFINEILVKYEYIFERADELSDEVKHPSAKVGALNVMLGATERMAKILQSTGVMDKVASKVEMEVTKRSKILDDKINNMSLEEQEDALKLLSKLSPAKESM